MLLLQEIIFVMLSEKENIFLRIKEKFGLKFAYENRWKPLIDSFSDFGVEIIEAVKQIDDYLRPHMKI